MSDCAPLVIGLVADCKIIGPHPFHALGDKYIRGITEGMNAIPLLIPAMGEPHLLETYLGMIDGLLLTGSPSNIEPHHYQGEAALEPIHDPERDATTLPLISMAIEADIPLLGICRGFQEINVALGGTLHQRVQELPGYMDHREDPEQPVEVQYGPAHDMVFEVGSLLAAINGTDRAEVNSIHQQGIDCLATGLQVEARAPDGLIEAFRMSRADRFVLGVQWHPEWKVTENPFYQSIFTAFKSACEVRKA
ncbi:gamma-glutamyl-gamma-aminobutyrate hydrolase family protein [Maricurvus nonylphenolicus]|uniref:gamma-glutamyl-gamma-aminobutyrate hydrolase family protein n=1 Tax=Maricurvus nonylphenolicus TaxID=1008307 RepID=UPI0036F2516F